MNIDTLKMIITIARTGTISAAATQLGYAQSNISSRLRQLENKLGTTIFYRTNRGVILTEDGKQFYQRAIQIVNLTEDTVNQLRRPRDIEGDLHIGTLQTASTTYLPAILTKYHQTFPKVNLAIEAHHRIKNIQQVLNHELDGAVVGEINQADKLTTIPLSKEKLCLISNSDKMPDFKTTPFLTFPIGCVYREVADKWFASKSMKAPQLIQFNYLDAILASVCSGLGASIVPKKTAQPYVFEGLINTFPLPAEFSTIQLDFIYRDDYIVNKPFEKFIDILTN
ncbi:LysR family transcriptional regulator [Companilactobacillus halodurans]|uniref:LysR family transcriptional regulator n=1 Tax=Companilactobacillus halodurans TaxID=2584183 RepID=A0A5P0ZWW9_9LACO|nr:LysR family transcriptional regulator [Companilactobacillus halodurans]MQS76450.1 LysR family transcriptional regulator [Companilactobacillus halodurans]MQS97529.1 LysR family transcriptional regulator [Companilactobacillus halodurans]